MRALALLIGGTNRVNGAGFRTESPCCCRAQGRGARFGAQNMEESCMMGAGVVGSGSVRLYGVSHVVSQRKVLRDRDLRQSQRGAVRRLAASSGAARSCGGLSTLAALRGDRRCLARLRAAVAGPVDVSVGARDRAGRPVAAGTSGRRATRRRIRPIKKSRKRPRARRMARSRWRMQRFRRRMRMTDLSPTERRAARRLLAAIQEFRKP